MRLMDAEELLKFIEEHSYLLCDYHNSKDKGMFLCGIQQAIAMMPTVEQKHGHWIKISPADIYECSVCGEDVMTGDIEAYKFCHGCGAKMEEVTE